MPKMIPWPASPEDIKGRILEVLHRRNVGERIFPRKPEDLGPASSVLVLLGETEAGNGSDPEPCLVFNKRSRRVRQPGDLCFPGGGLDPRWDEPLARLLALPGLPLARWPYWKHWKRARPVESRRLALFLAAGLREGLEEMLLNPFGVEFLGHLPPRSLIMFRRVIYPLVGWAGRQKRFRPNWEVERILRIPLRELLDPARYANYRVRVAPGLRDRVDRPVGDFACFVHRRGDRAEILWGATFHIVMGFLNLVFGFEPPGPAGLPVIRGVLEEAYAVGGRRWAVGRAP